MDVTGKPTTWGRWSPAYFTQEPGDSALNSLELLSFLKTAAHITGNARFADEYKKVAAIWATRSVATRYKELREEINYSDEELAMLSFYNLFRYETDGELTRPYYRPALHAWWENMAREENPLWTFIYSRRPSPAPLDLASAARTLYRMPIDTIEWTVQEFRSSGSNHGRGHRPVSTAASQDSVAARRASGDEVEFQSVRYRWRCGWPRRRRRRRISVALLDGPLSRISAG